MIGSRRKGKIVDGEMMLGGRRFVRHIDERNRRKRVEKKKYTPNIERTLEDLGTVR